MSDADIPLKLRVLDKWSGIVAALLLPVAIPLATCVYSQGEKASEDKRACIDLRLKSVAAVAQSRAPGAGDAVPLMTDTLKLLNQLCPKDLQQDPSAQQEQARAVLASTDNPAGAAKLMTVAGAPPPATVTGALPAGEGVQAATLDPSPALISEASRSAGVTPEQAASPAAVRVFIQVADAQEKPAAEAIRARLIKARFGAGPILAPGVQTVANTLAQPELRCLKAADCKKAQDLAVFLGAIMGGKPPAIRDFSRLYETRPSVRPGTYELWFGPGDLAATSTPPAAASS